MITVSKYRKGNEKRMKRFHWKDSTSIEVVLCFLIFIGILVFLVTWRRDDSAKGNDSKKAVASEESLNSTKEESKPEDISYDLVCSDGTLGPEAADQLAVRVATNEKYQKILDNSQAYPKSMLEWLIKNGELIDFIADYPEKKDDPPADSIGEVTQGQIPLLIQWDQRWGYQPYGDGMIADSGCGPTALAMVASGLRGDASITPFRIAQYAQENGYYVNGAGSSWELMTEACYQFGVAGNVIGLGEESVKGELLAGHPIICSVRAGDFTDGGHFIVLTSVQEDKIQVYDPNSIEKSSRLWDYAVLEPQIENLWSFTPV